MTNAPLEIIAVLLIQIRLSIKFQPKKIWHENKAKQKIVRTSVIFQQFFMFLTLIVCPDLSEKFLEVFISVWCIAPATKNPLIQWTLTPKYLDCNFHFFSLFILLFFTEMEVRASLVGSGNMIQVCTCLTQLDQNFVQTFGVLLLDHILSILLKFLSDEATVNNFFSYLLIYGTLCSHLFSRYISS